MAPSPKGPGRPKEISDAELICLAAAHSLVNGNASERKWIRIIHSDPRWRALFPNLPSQSEYNRRLRALGDDIAVVIRLLAMDSPCVDHDWLTDGTPVPCGTSKATAERSALREEELAGYGYCAAHKRKYWGVRLMIVCSTDGLPVMWAFGNPKIGEREVLTDMIAIDRAIIKDGQIMIGDKGFSGKEFERTCTEAGIKLLRPDRRDEEPRFGNLGGVRQWVESVIDTLKGQTGLEWHGGRTAAGLFARIGQRLLAMAAAIWWNWKIDEPIKRSLIAYDH